MIADGGFGGWVETLRLRLGALKGRPYKTGGGWVGWPERGDPKGKI